MSVSLSLLSIQHSLALATDPVLLAVLEHLARDPDRLVALRADDHQVRDVDRGFALDDAALDVLRGVRLRVLLDEVDALDDRPHLRGVDPQHLAAGPLLAALAGDDEDHVVLAHVETHRLEDLRGERDDFHELALSQLSGHGTEDARPDRLLGVVDQDGGVLVEADVGAVPPALLFLRADDDRAHDLSLLDGAVGARLFHVRRDDVAEPPVASDGSAANVDARDPPGSRVVGDLEDRPHLDHGYFTSSTPGVPGAGFADFAGARLRAAALAPAYGVPASAAAAAAAAARRFSFGFGAGGAATAAAAVTVLSTGLPPRRMDRTRHLFRRLSGRVSTSVTTSPTLQAFASSCAWNFDVLFTTRE